MRLDEYDRVLAPYAAFGFFMHEPRPVVVLPGQYRRFESLDRDIQDRRRLWGLEKFTLPGQDDDNVPSSSDEPSMAPPLPLVGNGTVGAGSVLERLLTVQIRPGMGSGKTHALNKLYKSPPFPLATKASVAFDIMFANGFEWGCRGKVGGFVVGSGPADGHEHSAGAASYRLCWNSGGGAFVYVYVPAGTGARQPPGPLQTIGRNGAILWDKEFRSAFRYDTWHRVEMSLSLNRPGANDGTMTLTIDGKTQTISGMVWRVANQKISFFGLGIFHGGPCSATKNSSLTIRNMMVSGA